MPHIALSTAIVVVLAMSASHTLAQASNPKPIPTKATYSCKAESKPREAKGTTMLGMLQPDVTMYFGMQEVTKIEIAAIEVDLVAKRVGERPVDRVTGDEVFWTVKGDKWVLNRRTQMIRGALSDGVKVSGRCEVVPGQ
jgi:hypothetical protein